MQKEGARIAAEYNACYLVPQLASSCGYIVRVEKINALINVVYIHSLRAFRPSLREKNDFIEG